MAINFVKSNGSAKVATVPTVAPPMDLQAIISAAVAQAVAQATAPMTGLALEVERLKAENAKLAAMPVAAPRPLTCRVSDKGAVSVYGLGQFPATYYESQWERIFAEQQTIKDFIKANKPKLATKPVKS